MSWKQNLKEVVETIPEETSQALRGSSNPGGQWSLRHLATICMTLRCCPTFLGASNAFKTPNEITTWVLQWVLSSRLLKVSQGRLPSSSPVKWEMRISKTKSLNRKLPPLQIGANLKSPKVAVMSESDRDPRRTWARTFHKRSLGGTPVRWDHKRRLSH